MTSIWIHTGMHKTGSTTIQHFLANALPDFARRDWRQSDVAASLTGPGALTQLLTGDWSRYPVPWGWSALALRSADKFVISSEDYTSQAPTALEQGAFAGLVFLRAPADWVPSAIAQSLLFNNPSQTTVPDPFHSILSSDNTTNYLHAAFSRWTAFFLRAIDNARKWSERSEWFDVVPYLPTTDILGTVSASLAKFGVTVSPQGPSPVLRTSSPVHLALLALEIYRTAVFEFGIPPKDALPLARLALGVEPGILRGYLAAPTDITTDAIADALRDAHRLYEVTVAELAPDSRPAPFRMPTFAVLDDEFGRDLARSLIRASQYLARLPDDFDPLLYLAMNPDVAKHAQSLSNPESFARAHFARHGAFEIRPAPRRS